jgi:hypothetical protein
MTLQERLPPGKYRLSVDDFARLAETGVFGDQRTELIEGDVIVMAPESLTACLCLWRTDISSSSGAGSDRVGLVYQRRKRARHEPYHAAT